MKTLFACLIVIIYIFSFTSHGFAAVQDVGANADINGDGTADGISFSADATLTVTPDGTAVNTNDNAAGVATAAGNNTGTITFVGASATKGTIGAAGAAMTYISEMHKGSATTISSLRTYSTESHMIVDSTTQRNLELVRNARDNSTRGTLFEVLSKTVTPMVLLLSIIPPVLPISG